VSDPGHSTRLSAGLVSQNANTGSQNANTGSIAEYAEMQDESHSDRPESPAGTLTSPPIGRKQALPPISRAPSGQQLLSSTVRAVTVKQTAVNKAAARQSMRKAAAAAGTAVELRATARLQELAPPTPTKRPERTATLLAAPSARSAPSSVARKLLAKHSKKHEQTPP
jgi:hypothetical protein